MDESPTEITPVFRPLKRRKVFRPRESSQSPLPEDNVTALDQPGSGASPERDPASPPSIAELLRQRKALVRKRRGIEFSAANLDHPLAENGAKQQPTGDAELVEYATRFAPQTGQVADVNKHMMAYVDAEIERRFRPPSPGSSNNPYSSAAEQSPAARQDHSVHRQPAALGRLMEIDLGPDARAKNVAATELARAVRDGVAVEEPPDAGKPGKKGRWRRRRRNSEDLRRDRIVEEVLKETRLEVYEEPVAAASGDAQSDEEDDEAADERVAEQFRREFLDAAQQARRKRQPANNAPTKGKEAVKDTKSKGPKLGGSRSARAAMREKELAEKGRPGAK